MGLAASRFSGLGFGGVGRIRGLGLCAVETLVL